MENNIEVPQKLKIELSFDPAIPLLSISPEEKKTLIRKDICTPMFTAGLFTVDKIRNNLSAINR